MPSILTHYIFALENTPAQSKYFNAIMVGAQGPDPYFFYAQTRKRMGDKKVIREFGSKLHHTDIAPIYNAMIEYANTSKEKELLYSYIQGLFFHYALDRNCHPYIFSKTGFSSDPKLSAIYSNSHAMFEAYVDVAYGKKHNKLTYKVWHCMDIDKSQLMIISKMWYFVNKKTLKWPEIKENTFYEAAIDQPATMKFTNSFYQIKTLLIELVQGKGGQGLSFILPRKFKGDRKDLDYLNEKKTPWVDCLSGDMREESFEELVKKAKADFKEANKILEKAKKGQDVQNELSSYVHKIDHDGKPTDSQYRYFKSIWPSFPGLD